MFILAKNNFVSITPNASRYGFDQAQIQSFPIDTSIADRFSMELQNFVTNSSTQIIIGGVSNYDCNNDQSSVC